MVCWIRRVVSAHATAAVIGPGPTVPHAAFSHLIAGGMQSSTLFNANALNAKATTVATLALNAARLNQANASRLANWIHTFANATVQVRTAPVPRATAACCPRHHVGTVVYSTKNHAAANTAVSRLMGLCAISVL